MRMRERIYFLITLLLSLAAMILSAVLWIGHYDAEKKLFSDTPVILVLAVLLALGAVFCLSGLFMLKGLPLRRLPKAKGGVIFFGVLTGLFVLAAFALGLLYGRTAEPAVQTLSNKVVSVGTAASTLFCAAYFVYVSFARKLHLAIAGWLGLGAMLWCTCTAVSLYFDMSYALSSPVRLLNMMAALSMLLYVTGEVRFFLGNVRMHQYETFAYLFILFGFAYSVPKAIYDFTLGAPSAETVLALAQCSAVLYTISRLFALLRAKPIKNNPNQPKKENDMEYTCKHYEYLSDVDWNKVEKAMIDKFGWGYTDYKPLCYAQGVYTDDAGMVIKLTAFEQNPRATKTEFMDSVCNDSCLEFFFSADRVAYTNFEFNALGTQHTSVGAPGHRGPIDQFTERPVIKAERFDDRWTITFALSHKMVKDITGKELTRGAQFYGNFYKCGDECEHKHYGMWNEVETDTPSFHQPAYFGILHIG